MRQLEAGSSDGFIWEIYSLKFVFDSEKVAQPSSDPLIEPAKSFSSLIFRTHRHGYNFSVKFYPYGIGTANGKCASILFTLFPGDHDSLNLQWPFSKLKWIRWTHGRKQCSLIKTRPTGNPQSQQKQELRQSSATSLFLTLNSLTQLKVF